MNKIFIEKQLLDLWRRLLGVNNIDSRKDFYEFGGNSFLAIQLLFLIKKEMGINMCPSIVVRRPLNIAYLVKKVQASVCKPLMKSRKEDPFYKDARAVRHLQLKWPVYRHEKIKRILLTGANGFVGVHLLDSLMRQSDCIVYCLVRGKNKKDTGEKLRRSMSFFRLAEINTERLKIITGDLSKTRFGLSHRQFDSFAEKIDVIVHAGAIVNFEMDYAALRMANVNGIKEILRFSARIKPKPIHYISSLAVLGIDHAKKIKHEYAEDRVVNGKPKSAYAQTKLVAEKYIEFSMKRGLQANVYRLGEVAPSTLTGIPNPKSLHHFFIKACQTLLAYPRGSPCFDYIPVDFVADCIVKIVMNDKKQPYGKLFHICHPKGVSFDRFFKLLSNGGQIIRPLGGKSFLNFLKKQPPYTQEIAMLKLFIEKQILRRRGCHHPFEPFFLKEMSAISTKNIYETMKKQQSVFPVINKQMLAHYIFYLKLSG